VQSELTIKELLHSTILSCPPDTPLSEASRKMTSAKCSSILVMDGHEAVGIWTEHDALALDFSDSGQHELPISRFMSSPVATIDVTATIGEAALRFRDAGIRHFLVTDATGDYKGILSQSDVVLNQGIEYFVSMRELDSVFTRQIVSIPGVMVVADAVREMYRNHLDAIVVEKSDGQHGILTERDVVRLISAHCPTTPVQDVASFPLLSLPLNATLYEARKLFMTNRVRHLGVTDSDGGLAGLVTFSGILANIEHEYVHHLRQALRETEASLAASNQRLRLAAKAFETTLEGILVTDAEGNIESVNPAFSVITGYAAEEVIGKNPSILASGRHDQAFYESMYQSLEQTGHWQGEICNRRKNGQLFFEWMAINAVRDVTGRLTNYVAVFSDFTARKAAEEQVLFLSQHDPLTGLANRALLLQQLQRAIAHARRNETKLAVIFIDLDEFKDINDRFGHEVGDDVLKAVAQRLVQSARAEDTVARLGGDEFVMLIEDLVDAEHVTAIAGKIMASLISPITVDGGTLRTFASTGIAIFPDDGADPGELIRNADMAMYGAKQGGGDACQRHCGAVA
jgi:diguanylate cyclase (GGDEF)-like protein/PAS domain S-box-containing protein